MLQSGQFCKLRVRRDLGKPLGDSNIVRRWLQRAQERYNSKGLPYEKSAGKRQRLINYLPGFQYLANNAMNVFHDFHEILENVL